VLERLGLLKRSFRSYEAIRSLRPYRIPPGLLDGLPLPPTRLRFRVSGEVDPAWFLESGRLSAATVEDALGRHGFELERVGRLLDFGCGCGRLIRHWHTLSSVTLHGCDRDPSGVRWCSENLRFGHFATHGPGPPLPYPDEWFGAVCAVSVFTHLPEGDQLAWVQELRRLLIPGGIFLLTTHGDRYLGRLMPDERVLFEAGRVVVRSPSAVGSTLCTAFHPESYVREFLADGFELLEFSPGGAAGTPYQDLVVLRKPSKLVADQRPSR
jgi:SAM-dependent methyltransferase